MNSCNEIILPNPTPPGCEAPWTNELYTHVIEENRSNSLIHYNGLEFIIHWFPRLAFKYALDNCISERITFGIKNANTGNCGLCMYNTALNVWLVICNGIPYNVKFIVHGDHGGTLLASNIKDIYP